LAFISVAPAAEDVDVSGQWSGTWSASPQYNGPCWLALVQKGGELTGEVQVAGRPILPASYTAPVKGRVQGDRGEIVWTSPLAGDSPHISRYEFRLVGDDTLTGSGIGPRGSLTTLTLKRSGAAPRAPVSGQEILTNDSILQMVGSGLPEGLIVAKIRSSQTTFDVRTETLIALKQVGVSDNVLEAMVAQPAQAASPPPSSFPSAPAPAQPPPPPPSAGAPPLPGTVIIPGVPVPIQIPSGVPMGSSGASRSLATTHLPEWPANPRDDGKCSGRGGSESRSRDLKE